MYPSKGRLKDSVSVYCRLKPSVPGDPLYITLISATKLAVSAPTDKILKKEHFVFKRIFTFVSQCELFDNVMHPLLEDLFNGGDALLFTHGATAFDKMCTLTGDQNNPGLIPRCIHTIFNRIIDLQAPKFAIKPDGINGFEVQTAGDALEDTISEQRQLRTNLREKNDCIEKMLYTNHRNILDINETYRYAVFISYTAMCKNTLYDLFDDKNVKHLHSKIMREDSEKNMYVSSVVETEVKPGVEVFKLFALAEKRRRTLERPHSIFNIKIGKVKNDRFGECIPDSNLIKTGQLSLVDLAGSESAHKTQNTGIRLKETSCTNNSLLTLRKCFEILRDNQMNNANRPVPYRESKLILLFKSYFEGKGKVEMIICVNPSTTNYEQNLKVIKFGEISKVKIVKPESRYIPYREKQKPSRRPNTRKVLGKVNVKRALVGMAPEVSSTKLKNLETCEESSTRLTVSSARRRLDMEYSEAQKAKKYYMNKVEEITNNYELLAMKLRNLETRVEQLQKKLQDQDIQIIDLKDGLNQLADEELRQCDCASYARFL